MTRTATGMVVALALATGCNGELDEVLGVQTHFVKLDKEPAEVAAFAAELADDFNFDIVHTYDSASEGFAARFPAFLREDLETLDGAVRLSVPAGSDSGKRLRLRGKGMPIMRSSQHGDMYIQVTVQTPTNLTRRQRELLAEFEKESSGENHPESAGFFSKVKDFIDNLGA